MKPGLYDDFPMHAYLALPYLSSGLCNLLLSASPFHAKWHQDHPEQDDTNASDMGTAVHDALLEGIDRIEAIEAPDWRTKAAKEAREAAREAGRIPMLAHKVARVQAAVDAARAFVAQTEIAGCFDGGHSERTVVWDEGGTLCKARPDKLFGKWHISVKTTEASARPGSWIRRQLTPMGYDVALSFYDRGLLSNGIETEGRLLVIEQNPPYGCCLVGLSPLKKDLADRRAAFAIEMWKRCSASGKWPAYPLQTCFAEAAAWELAEQEAVENGGDPLEFMDHDMVPA